MHYYYYYYGSTALCWDLDTEQNKHRINAHNTDIHALSGILTHDPSVRASEDSSCLRPRGHCDRQEACIAYENFLVKSEEKRRKR
jgi:hypothetical protein